MSNCSHQISEEQRYIFRKSAASLLEANNVVVPCGGPNGKKPEIPWGKLSLGSLRRKLPELLEKFGSSNIAIVCGPSRKVVVDLDEPALLEEMLERFGPTQLVVRTGSGGYHAYYRQGAESIGCFNLRHIEDLAVDIKGSGGLVIAPPSLNPQTNKRYGFYSGSWADLNRLPLFDSKSLPWLHARKSRRPSGQSTSRIQMGRRNDTLFREVLRHARHCDNFDALLDVARTRNEFLCEVPLSSSEVINIARSAWQYQQSGRNWVGQAAKTVLTADDLQRFAAHSKGGDALLLWSHLLNTHQRHGNSFAVDREAMAKGNIFPGWTAWRFRMSLKALLELQFLVRVGGGKLGPENRRTPHQYKLSPALAGSRQNTIETCATPSSVSRGDGR